VLLVGFPWSGLVVPGILVGIDMTVHGTWWLALGLFVRRPSPSGSQVEFAKGAR
jgi:uncharacterized membrane protein HdeD (DUF308 family)